MLIIIRPCGGGSCVTYTSYILCIYSTYISVCLLPDDEVGAPLCVLIEDVVDLVQHLPELGELERLPNLRQQVCVGVLRLRVRFVQFRSLIPKRIIFQALRGTYSSSCASVTATVVFLSPVTFWTPVDICVYLSVLSRAGAYSRHHTGQAACDCAKCVLRVSASLVSPLSKPLFLQRAGRNLAHRRGTHRPNHALFFLPGGF